MEHPTRPTAGPATYLPKAETGRTLPADRTVLLVIDPVNDFLSEGGAAWEMTKGTVEKNNVIPNLKRAIDGARSQGIPVLFGPMAYTEEDYAQHHLQKRSGINRLMFEKRMFLAGSWGADFHPEIQPQAQDIVLLPHKSCDVFQTDLAGHLESRGITHLVIAGMTANLCCESTGRHGTEAGYDVTSRRRHRRRRPARVRSRHPHQLPPDCQRRHHRRRLPGQHRTPGRARRRSRRHGARLRRRRDWQRKESGERRRRPGLPGSRAGPAQERRVHPPRRRGAAQRYRRVHQPAQTDSGQDALDRAAHGRHDQRQTGPAGRRRGQALRLLRPHGPGLSRRVACRNCPIYVGLI
ncbi:cysteine hydrolase family protein [Hymenobacter roseosalivarius]|uniref:cysteine hydrolase family protein n=1 Tax=Hymenobacter roseosalivarius TaxID=89967 RepID=UPI000A02F750|nr:isochorismatase family cysteine hydrolase [Hymenobacter roseosalivarius]